MKIFYTGLFAVLAGGALLIAVQSCKQDDSSNRVTPTLLPTLDPAGEPSQPTVEPVPVPALPDVPEDRRAQVTENKILNLEATIPPQCYTKTDGHFNPCYTCHQLYDRRADNRLNQLDDGSLQGDYGFSDVGLSNHWSNLFVDRTEWLTEVSDATIRHYVDTENYTSLPDNLAAQEWQGFVPDLENYQLAAEAFDGKGLAKDGSYWVAFNYKPFPGTFWPTNGSTDDVIIRLPAAFREVNGEFNADVYYANLTLIELNIKRLDSAKMWPLDENVIGADVDNNGVMEMAEAVHMRSHYFGDASNIELAFQQFPTGTEFMHSVRYVGLNNEDEVIISARMKELRYMTKVNVLSREIIESRYAYERKEKLLGALPSFINNRDLGFDNGLGWYVHGFIEDYNGNLRPQTFEERTFCMGCHSAIGTTQDSTFSFARKVTGAAGWKYIDLRGMKDAPSIAESDGEIMRYLKRSGGGNEFRQNPEMVEKWFNEDGSIKEDEVRAADMYTLTAPSPERALKLNKAYTHIVRHQSFIFGRDPTWTVSENIFHEINEQVPPLETEHRFYGWDLTLDWSE